MSAFSNPPSIQPLATYLRELEGAVAGLANTWQPDSPEYRADVYRQIMMQLSYGYFAFFHADAEHPDWAPLWNPVYTLQPNPDDIYLQSPISSAYSYRVSGHRGTVKMVTFNTQRNNAGYPGPVDMTGEHYSDLDDRDLTIVPDGTFDILLSTERPDGKFRAVLALEDPGVPNWLDTAGFIEGTIYVRWYDCDSCPTPTLKRVSFSALRDHLPADTLVFTAERRAEELRQRVRGCQRRRRW